MMNPRDLGPSNDIASPFRERTNDPESIRRAAAALMLRAQRARHSPIDFFEFVIRHETTHTPLIAPAHMRLMFDFVDAHDRCVVMAPPKFGKTFTSLVFTLRLLGQDPSSRGAIISAACAQAEKPLKYVRDYIENSSRLRLVYPELRRSQRQGDPWTQTAITVDRPYGIRDPSLIAIGMDSKKLPGARLNWIVVDDILVRDNTDTKEQRDKTHIWLDSTVQARLDERAAKMIVLNTAWHPDDVAHRYERAGWATLRMSVDGDVHITTPPIDLLDGTRVPDLWGMEGPAADELRMARDSEVDPTGVRSKCRLAAHDPDIADEVPLWPEVFGPHVVAKIRNKMHPVEFNRVYRQECRDDDTALCKVEWIDACKKKGRDHGIYAMQSKPTPKAKLVFIGVDLAVSPGEDHDDTAFVTFELWPDGTRCLLEVDCGQFDGPTTVAKIAAKSEQYTVGGLEPLVMVENNAGQEFILQFLRTSHKRVLVDGYTTGRTKAHPEHGVPGFFTELHNGVWVIPNDARGICHPQVQRLIDACLYYAPNRHTDDALMAMFMARMRASRLGISFDNDGSGKDGFGFDPLAR